MTDGSFVSILKQAASNPEANLPGFGLEVRFNTRSPGFELPEGSLLVLDGSGEVSVSIPLASGSGILPGLYAGRASTAEVEEWILQLRESGVEKHTEDSDGKGDVTLSVLSANHAFRFSLSYTDKVFMSLRPALESMVAQALNAPQWAISLHVRTGAQPGKTGTELLFSFSNPGVCGIWIDYPTRPPASDEPPVCEIEFARKPQIVPVDEFERLKRTRIAINPVESEAPLLWLGPRMTVNVRANALFPAHERIVARLKYRSESGHGIIPGMPRFIGSVVSPVFEVQT